jgi:prolyl 4-hydroxylase
MVDTLYRRVSDVLRIDERYLNRDHAAEDIQVVHYEVDQEYLPHFDWGVRGYPESRYITVLLYLSDVEKGGETHFPLGGNTTGGFKIIPHKGNAVIFYSLLSDGNADVTSLHAALPVEVGEKWLANFWVWDPSLPSSLRKTA